MRSENKTELTRIYEGAITQSGDISELQSLFAEDLPEGLEAEELFQDCVQAYEGQELAEVCAELTLSLNAACERDDFHNWDYDHLEFIIGLSKAYEFDIPSNLLNGLPEQLILLVD